MKETLNCSHSNRRTLGARGMSQRGRSPAFQRAATATELLGLTRARTAVPGGGGRGVQMSWLGLQSPERSGRQSASCTALSLFCTRARGSPPRCLGRLFRLQLAHCPRLSHLSSRGEPGSLLRAGDSHCRNCLAVHTPAVSGSSRRAGSLRCGLPLMPQCPTQGACAVTVC